MKAGTQRRRRAAGEARDSLCLSCASRLFGLAFCLCPLLPAVAQRGNAHPFSAGTQLAGKPSASHPAIPPVPAGNRNTARPMYERHAMAALPERPFANPTPQNSRPPYPPPPSKPRGINADGLGSQSNPNDRGEHLGSWMRQHGNQSSEEQERALEREPGFNHLAPQQQQNLVNRLHQLDQMPPAQRQRTLNRIESMERLSPERRQAVRSSFSQLGQLPQDRKRMVQKAFRDLRDMPPEQRQAVINSPQFAGQFSAQERSIMSNLLVVEPYQHAGPAPQYGK